ncbi:MAG: hypothetical protein FWB85_06750 [Chitinispirillia bacterium]|nr:hypothetical protein [Chitinispirillia bacterium]MCL2241922.1 hypothetical protein [Chitinispirillia bacterium]
MDVSINKKARRIFCAAAAAGMLALGAGCDDGGNSENIPEGGEKTVNPLVGTWYSAGATNAYGKTVVFTETTVTASQYANNYVDPYGVWNYEEKWFDNARYSFRNDTLEVLDFNLAGVQQSHPLETRFMFISDDTLMIKEFIPTIAAIPFPNNFNAIYLVKTRRDNAGSFVDERDNQAYPTVEIGGKRWMAKNLNYAGADGELGTCERYSYHKPVTAQDCGTYGRLYTWKEAIAGPVCTKKGCMDDNIECNTCFGGGCPSLWRLPSKADWDELIAFAGGDAAGKRLKAKNSWVGDGNGTDDYGFAALAAGKSPESPPFSCPQDNCYPPLCVVDLDGKETCYEQPCPDCSAPMPDGLFGEAGWWWSSTEIDESGAHSLYMRARTDEVYGREYKKSYAMSVRCVQDL